MEKEKEVKEDSKDNSFNNENDINNSNIHKKGKENYNYNFNSDKNKNEFISHYKNGDGIQNYIKNLNKNNSKINDSETIKKLNNKKVNTSLTDIYEAISNINEVNQRMKNILSNRPYIHKYKSVDYKNNKSNNFTEEKKDKILKSFRPITEDIITRNNNFIKEYNNILHNYPTYNINNKNSKTIPYFYSYNDINDNNKKSFKYKFTPNKRKNKNDTYKVNKYYNNLTSEYIKPIEKNSNNLKFLLFKTNNKNNNNNFYKEKLITNSLLNESTEKSIDEYNISNYDKSFSYYNNNDDDSLEEKNIKLIKQKLLNEEKKLKELQEEKHRLLLEEKIRRKNLTENHKKPKKGKSLIKEYKKKINMIKQLQTYNINEIIQLKKNKKDDEKKFYQAKSFSNFNDINKNIIKNKKINNHNYINGQNNVKIKKGNHIYNGFSKDNNNNKNISRNFEITDDFVGYDDVSNHGLKKNNSKSKIKEYINSKINGLMNNYKYINTLYDIANSNNSNVNLTNCTYNLRNESTKMTNNNNNNPKKIFQNLGMYENHREPKTDIDNYSSKYFYYTNNNDYNVNNTNNNYNLYKNNNYNNFIGNTNINNLKNNIKNNNSKLYDTSLGIEDYITQQNSNNKRGEYYLDFESKKNIGTKLIKKNSSSNIVPSFIEPKVNKYNYNINQQSCISQRILDSKIPHNSCRNNLNYKNSYRKNSNLSNKSKINNFSKGSGIRHYSKNNSKKDLNFKNIFFY